MSNRTIRFSSPKSLREALASSIFPTPVGPRKRKLPSGRFGSASPARARRTTPATAETASSADDPTVKLLLELQALPRSSVVSCETGSRRT